MKKFILIPAGKRKAISLAAVFFITIHLAFSQTTVLTQSFDAATFPPTGWKNQKIAGPTLPGNWNRVIAGMNPTNTPHSGAGEARFNSANYLAGTTADLVTNAIDLSTTGIYTVSFWIYRDNSASAAADKLDVYVNTIQNSAGGSLIGTIYRNRSQSPAETANGWYQYTYTIPAGYSGSANYIAFRATSGFGGNIFLDDIAVVRYTATLPACLGTYSPATGSSGVCRNTALSWSSVLFASGYKLTMGTNAPDYNNLINNLDLGNINSYTLPLLSASTTYNWKLIPYNIYGSPSGCDFKSFSTGAGLCYCTPEYIEASCVSEDFIDNFSTTGATTNIVNNGTGCSADGVNNYAYFSSLTVTASQASSFNISMQSGSDFPEGFGIWADWNQDGDFSDASEFLYASPSASTSAFNTTVTVPETALTGVTRLRIRCQFGLAPTATQSCESMEDGETEDYNIQVTPCTATTWFADADADTYGNAAVTVNACAQPAGYVAVNTDCNDASASVHPGLTDICNAVDDDCDALYDEDAVFTNYFPDADMDSYGSSSASATSSCSAIAGAVTNNTDCNDGNSAVFPGAAESCNGIDDNCTGGIDEGLTFISYYQDLDADTYGNSAVTSSTCNGAPVGYVIDNADCNDGDPTVHPGAAEVCNAVDDNCSGAADEGLTFQTSYQDSDADTYGNAAVSIYSCNAISPGYVPDHTDCNDAAAAVHPGSTEICNGIDDNCNASVDEGVINTTVSASGSLSFCTPGSVTLIATSGYTTYQWKKNGVNIAGATHPTYKAKATGNYTVVITSGSCSATSSVSAVNAVKAPKSTITVSGGLDLCPTGSVVLKGVNGSGISYQWYKNGSAISGAVSRNYTAISTGSYVVRVTNSTGCFKDSPASVVYSSCRITDDSAVMLEIYPNPASTSFNLMYSGIEDKGDAILQITDLVGNIVYSAALSLEKEGSLAIAIPDNTASGIYTVHLIFGHQELIKQLMITR